MMANFLKPAKPKTTDHDIEYVNVKIDDVEFRLWIGVDGGLAVSYTKDGANHIQPIEHSGEPFGPNDLGELIEVLLEGK